MANNETNTVDTAKELKKLSDFANSIEKVLKSFENNAVLASDTKEHRDKLQKLLDATNKILSGNSTQRDTALFEELVNASEMSLQVLQKTKRDDNDFQNEMKKTFGGGTNQGSLSKELSRSLSLSLSDVLDSANIINSEISRDAAGTAVDFLGGPLAKIAGNSIDTEKLGNLFQQDNNDLADSIAEEIKQPTTQFNSNSLRDMYAAEEEDKQQLRNAIGNPINYPNFDINDNEKPFKDLNAEIASQHENRMPVAWNTEDQKYYESDTNNILTEILGQLKMWETNSTELSNTRHNDLIESIKLLGFVFSNTTPNNYKNAALTMADAFDQFKTTPILVRNAPAEETKTNWWNTLFAKQEKQDTDILKAAQDKTTLAIKGRYGISGLAAIFKNIFTLGGVSRARKLEQTVAEKKRKGEFTGIIAYFQERSLLKLREEGILAKSGLRQDIKNQTKAASKNVLSSSEAKTYFSEAPNWFETIIGLLEDGLGVQRRIREEIEQTAESQKPGFFSGITSKLFYGITGLAAAGAGLVTLAATTLGTYVGGLIAKAFASPIFRKGLLNFSIQRLAGFASFSVGKLIGEYVFNPIFEQIDEFFGHKLGDAIGRGLTKTGLYIEEYIGSEWTKKIFGQSFKEQFNVNSVEEFDAMNKAMENISNKTYLPPSKEARQIIDMLNWKLGQEGIDTKTPDVTTAKSTENESNKILNNLTTAVTLLMDRSLTQQTNTLKSLDKTMRNIAGSINTPGLANDPGTLNVIRGNK